MKAFLVNLGVAVGGWWASHTLEEKLRLYATLATGVWFTLQSVFFLWGKIRKRRASRHPFARD